MVETLKLEEKNMKKIKENAETLVAVERERERERESLYSTWNSFTRLYHILPFKKKKKKIK